LAEVIRSLLKNLENSKKMRKTGFNENELRTVFDQLDSNSDGIVEFNDVRFFVKFLGEKIF
jgi:Ca2+-binding EF-hand superfamily protein